MGIAFDTIIRGGSVVSSSGIKVADIGILGSTIVAVGDLSECSAQRVVLAHNQFVLPGLIDTQVHFREPGMTHKEDLESGSRAAVMGGVTTFFEMPNTLPNTTSAQTLADKLEAAEGRCWANYSFFVGATSENAPHLAEYEMLPGTPGIKIFVGSSTGTLLVEAEEVLKEVLMNGTRPTPVHAEDEARLRERKAMISDHPTAAEHPHLRDATAAVMATERMIRLSRETGRPVHILHVSTADELPIIAAAKQEGLKITCEVTPQHMTFDSSDYETLGTFLQMNPPIRDPHHREAIVQAIQDDLFDVFGSDHAPHTIEEKSKPYPNSPSGMPGVQTMLGVLLGFVKDGKLTLEKLVRMGAERPAELYGIEGKGKLEVGYDADIVVVDMDNSQPVTKDWLQSKCDWSPYEGRTFPGRITSVWVGGHLTVDRGRLEGTPHGTPAKFIWKSNE